MGRLSNKQHKWTKTEDEALISALTELCQSGWKRENNIFKSGYTTVLEKELKSKLPGCNLKASPHIESRLKTLKKHCDAITKMKDAFGYDDDVWEDWVKGHSDAKGLRNKPFPYYDDLRLIFGKHRGNHRSVEDASDANQAVETYETSDYAGDMSKEEQIKVSENVNCELDHEEANGHKGIDDMAADDDSNEDDDVSIDDATHVTTNNKGQSSNLSSRTEGLEKIIEALIKKQDEQFSVLVGIVGLDVAAADKRTKLNGELKKIPNLSLQARLRAASLIVGDAAKLDLFYSLSDEEKKEWVSMLLSGLI